MDPVTVKGLLGISVMVMMIGGPVALLKVVDYYKERKAPASRRVASTDWLDPELRRN